MIAAPACLARLRFDQRKRAPRTKRAREFILTKISHAGRKKRKSSLLGKTEVLRGKRKEQRLVAGDGFEPPTFGL
jgi:hypothetical protein